MTEEQVTSTRKRGGQPANGNALKHGFYSRWFRELELIDLEQNSTRGVEDVIAMMHVMMRRTFEQATRESPDLEAMSKTLTALGRSSMNLGYLLRIQAKLESQSDEITSALAEALSDVLKEMQK